MCLLGKKLATATRTQIIDVLPLNDTWAAESLLTLTTLFRLIQDLLAEETLHNVSQVVIVYYPPFGYTVAVRLVLRLDYFVCYQLLYVGHL